MKTSFSPAVECTWWRRGNVMSDLMKVTLVLTVEAPSGMNPVLALQKRPS